MIKFSIVVPIYNVEKYIGELIESLQKQTLHEIEIILVDDGSPDKSGEICDKYAEGDERITVIHKKNGGVSAARNDGLAIAKGEYIMFCDSDDWLPLDALQKLYEEGKKVDADIVVGEVYQSEKGKNRLAKFYSNNFVCKDHAFIRKLIQADFYKTYCPMPHPVGPAFGYGGPWNKAVKLSLIKDNDIKFDVRVKGIFDDIIYTAYILANAKIVSYIQDPVYYYRIIPNSITRTYKANALEINNVIFNSWKEFIDKYGKDGYFDKPYYAVVIRRFVEILPVYFLSDKNPKSFWKRMKEMNQVMNAPEYQKAIMGVDSSKLTTFQKTIWRLMKCNSPIAIWATFKGKEFIKSFLK